MKLGFIVSFLCLMLNGTLLLAEYGDINRHFAYREDRIQGEKPATVYSLSSPGELVTHEGTLYVGEDVREIWGRRIFTAFDFVAGLAGIPPITKPLFSMAGYPFTTAFLFDGEKSDGKTFAFSLDTGGPLENLIRPESLLWNDGESIREGSLERLHIGLQYPLMSANHISGMLTQLVDLPPPYFILGEVRFGADRSETHLISAGEADRYRQTWYRRKLRPLTAQPADCDELISELRELKPIPIW